MRLTSLTLTNFRQHAASVIEFPSEGIIGILGANEAGKSSVLEGAMFALYGADALRSTVDAVRWKRAPASRKAEAELVFELGGKTFRVHRTEKTAHVYEGDSLAPIAAGTSPVNAYLRKEILRMSYDEFTRSHVCLQKDLTALASMKPTPRQEFVREVLGLTVLDRALEGCRKRKNGMEKERDGLKVGLGDREPLVEEFDNAQRATAHANAWRADAEDEFIWKQAELGAAQEKHSGLAILAHEHDRLTGLRDSARTRQSDAAEQVRKLTEQLEAAQVAHIDLTKVEAELTDLAASRDKIQRAKERAAERAGLVKSIAATEMDLRTVTEQVAQYEAVIAAFDNAAFQAARQHHDVLTKSLNALRTKRSDELGQATEARAAAARDLDKARRKIAAIEEAGANGACPTCLRALGSALEVVLMQLVQEMADAETRGKLAYHRVEAAGITSDDEVLAEEDLKAAEHAVKEHRVRQTKAETATAERNNGIARKQRAETALAEHRERLAQLPAAVPVDDSLLSRMVARIAALNADVAKLRTAAGGRDTLQHQIVEWQEKHRTALQDLEAAMRDLIALSFDADAYKAAQTALSTAQATVADLTTKLATAEAEAKAAVDRFQRAKKALADHDTRAQGLTDLEERIRIHELAAVRLNDFRVAQAAAVRPEMEELISAFVNVLTDGRHPTVTVNEDFSLTLQKDGVDEEVVSGGTEDLAALAQRIAISVMIAERAGHPLSLLWLDEPFLSSDEVRRSNVLNLIRDLKSRFVQVLMSSHVAETRTCADHIIELAYDEDAGCSRIVSAPTVPSREIVEEAA